MPRARLHIAALMRAVHPCTRGRYRVIIVPSDVTLSARAPCAGEDFVWYFYIDPPLGTVPEPTCANPPPVAASWRFAVGECSTPPTDDLKADMEAIGCKSYKVVRGSSSGDDDSGSSNPCFARETTTACRVHDIAAPPADAYAQCFLGQRGAAAERVLMTSLSAGDYVLTQADGALAHTRVILNQHKVARDADASSPLLTLYHDRGTLGLSPDHVLRVGGEFGPARTATAGADLAAADGKPARVSRVEVSRGGVVNPLTVAGTILAAGPTGAPVLASVYGEWIADYFLGVATYPLPYSLGSALAYLFPEHVQAYYDAVLEPPFLAGAAHLKSISAAAPDAVIGAIVVGFDLALGAGFAAYALAAHAKVAVALAAVGAAAVYKKRQPAKAA